MLALQCQKRRTPFGAVFEAKMPAKVRQMAFHAFCTPSLQQLRTCRVRNRLIVCGNHMVSFASAALAEFAENLVRGNFDAVVESRHH